MHNDESQVSTKDRLVTVSVVIGAFFGVGLIGATIPSGWTASLVSGAMFVILIALYRLGAGPGRRSNARTFLLGGVLVLPLLIGWFVVLFMLWDRGADGPALNLLAQLQVGGSLRNCPHSGDFCGIVWWAFTLLMIGVSLGIAEAWSLLSPD